MLEANNCAPADLNGMANAESVNENDALAALHLLKLLVLVESRHPFAGIYQAAYQREVIEFICLLMRWDCELYTSSATLPPVKTIQLITAMKSNVCSLLQSNPFLSPHQTLLCLFGAQTHFMCVGFCRLV